MRNPLRNKRTLLRSVGSIFTLLVVMSMVFFFNGMTSMAKSPNTMQQSKDTDNLSNLKAEIINYTDQYQGEYGVYYYDLTTGQEFGINDEEQFTAASCVKVPLNLYLYQQIQSGTVNPETILTYTQGDYEDGTGMIQYQKVGTQYTIDNLSRLSIVQSDNVATNMLIRYLGMTNIKNYMRQVGGKVVIDDQNLSCPRDMGLYLKLVYESSENNSTLGGELMNDLLNTQLYNDRLPALLPKSIKVAHKIGNEVGVINDVGIIYATKPYIVAVMSNDVNEQEAPSVIANISKMIFDSVNQQ